MGCSKISMHEITSIVKNDDFTSSSPVLTHLCIFLPYYTDSFFFITQTLSVQCEVDVATLNIIFSF